MTKSTLKPASSKASLRRELDAQRAELAADLERFLRHKLDTQRAELARELERFADSSDLAKPIVEARQKVIERLEAELGERPKKIEKPSKPYKDFPLFAHATKRWAKKIRGRMYYFGRWEDPQGALDEYLKVKDELHAGETPRTKPDELTVKQLVNKYLNAKRHLVESGELSPRSFADYRATCESITGHFGKKKVVATLCPEDFGRFRAKLAKRLGPVSLGNEINRIRMVFSFAFEAELIERQLRFGPTFKRPTAKTLRKERATQRLNHGKRMFEAGEIRRLLDAANVPLRAMILLAINGGFGQSDLANLPLSAVDLEGGWIDFPRVKTGTERRVPLMPETVSALREAIASRPQPLDPSDSGLCFLTRTGRAWVRIEPAKTAKTAKAKGPDHYVSNDEVGKSFTKLMDAIDRKAKAAEQDGSQPEEPLRKHRRGFYSLRHSFETIAGESKDQVATDHIMGHIDGTMAGQYRESISDERLRAVVNHVHAWLFDNQEGGNDD